MYGSLLTRLYIYNLMSIFFILFLLKYFVCEDLEPKKLYGLQISLQENVFLVTKKFVTKNPDFRH